MQKTNAPTKFTVPFAASGTKNTIPVAASGTPGLASYTTGFPTLTMEPIASGGIPPEGQDFNGIHFDATKAVLWKQSGFQYAFDGTWAADSNIGGYPAQSLLCRADGNGLWLNLSDNNTTNPDATSPSGWVAVRANAGASTIALSGTTTAPDPSVLGVPVLIVTGALTANAAVVLPLTAGASWIVENNTTGAFSLTIKGATGSGVQVAQGNPSQVYTDGTNYYATTANVSGLYLPIGGNAVSASKLANARQFSITGLANANGVSFDGTGNVVLTVNALAPTGAEINAGLGYVAANDSNVVHTSGTETVAGAKTFSNLLSAPGGVTTSSQFFSDTPTPNDRYHYIYTNGSARWRFGGTSAAETGGNAGTDWGLTSFTDAGAFLASVITAARSTSLVTIGGALTVNGIITSAQSFVGNSSTAVLANSGASGSILLRPNGISSNTGQLSLTSSGAATFSGGVTCTTMNATSSDERLKEDIQEVDPRPLHRFMPFVSYTHKADGKVRRGRVAQQLALHAPEYMGELLHLERGQVEGVDAGDYLTIDMPGTAHEIATWAAMELDKQAQIIVAMQRAALAQQKTIQNLLNRVSELEAR